MCILYGSFRSCSFFLVLCNRNFGLLSFGEEAEEDESETIDFVQKNATKSKSVHDVVDDPKLSKETGTIPKSKNKNGDDADDDGNIEEHAVESDDESTRKAKADRVRDKLKAKPSKQSDEKADEKPSKVELDEPSDSDSDEFTNELERERKRKRQKKAYVWNTQDCCFDTYCLYLLGSFSFLFLSLSIIPAMKYVTR